MIRATEMRLSDDGLTVVGRMVPFGEVRRVRDPIEGGWDEYDEEFLPGCTARMRQTATARGGPTWVRFTFDHEPDFDNRIGYCTAMDEDGAGVNCELRLYDDPRRIDKVRSMLLTSHKGLSIEFLDAAPPRVDGNLRQRRQIHVGAVTATPIPVYSSAKVLAMRSDDDPYAGVGTPNLDRVRAMLAPTAEVSA